MNTKLIEFNIPEIGDFAFRDELTISEEIRVENEIVDLFGGWEKHAELENDILNIFKKHEAFCIDKFGETEFGKIMKRKEELSKVEEKTDKEVKESEELELKISNIHFTNYKKLLYTKAYVEYFVKLSTLVEKKPDHFSFEKTKKSIIVQMWINFMQQQSFFRSEKKEETS